MKLRITADVQCRAASIQTSARDEADAEETNARALFIEWQSACRKRHPWNDPLWQEGCTVEVSRGIGALFGGGGFDATVISGPEGSDWTILGGKAVCPACKEDGLTRGALKRKPLTPPPTSD